ncbi:MAG: DNA alkylation repair protein [Hamadaea sp.]|uniref:DNA alkylation repair protein n=1 Tax=Hamadaea sp. TaxID=2024425 RepID=UPI0017B69576|nr:DNA alkylation repair protein [Hamadaea sp.]NUT22418.1 DNA alkylation repair protein [Hamadaea sp.]
MSELATAFLTRLRDTLPRHADPERAAAMAKYMRDQFPFLGIPSTPLTVLQREAGTGLPRPESADAAEIALGCWEFDEREYQYVACSYLRKYAKALDEDFIGVLRELIVQRSWWDTVDALAAHVAGPLVSAYPSLVSVMDQWAEQEEMWLTRTAILHQLRYKGETDVDRLFGYCRRQAGHPDFFIRKAIGWALREYAKTEPDAVRRFVAATELSGLSRREALKNL